MNDPKNQEESRINYFAETNFRNKRVKFGIKSDDRRRHMYVIGKTGMGKSTLLENMVLNDIYAGAGLTYVDPHGDSVEKFLDFIPPSRMNDVVYFDPSDIEYPIAFNILETVDPNMKHIVASGLIGIFKKLWAESWGPRLEYVLRNAILALLDYPGSTILGILRILSDKAYREKVVAKVRDPVVKAFWVTEYSRYPDKFQIEAIAPIQNKVGQFLSNFLIRNIVGQVKSTIDIREIMDSGKILLLNLSKGKIGEDTSMLLGAMMITKIQIAAMSRVNMPEDQRRDFYLFVDEFQNFATESFASILSEARKYHLNLTIAHQYIEQLDEKVSAAVFGNVGTMACFRVGAMDAETLLTEFEPHLTEQDLVSLSKHDIYLKLMIDGVASEPFSATGLPPVDWSLAKCQSRDKVIRVSRERYSKPRQVVEAKIIRWSGMEVEGFENSDMMEDDETGVVIRKEKETFKKTDMKKAPQTTPSPLPLTVTAVPKLKSPENSVDTKKQKNIPLAAPSKETPRPNQYLEHIARQQAKEGVKQEKDLIEKDPDAKTSNRPYPAQCWSCNRLTYISFLPDGKRAVYCKICLREERMKKAAMRTHPASHAGENITRPAQVYVPHKTLNQAKESLNRVETMSEPQLVHKKSAPSLEEKQKRIQPGEIIHFDH